MPKFYSSGNDADYRSETTRRHGVRDLWEECLKRSALGRQGQGWREVIYDGEKSVSLKRVLSLCFGVVLLIPLAVTLVLSLAPLLAILCPPWAVTKVIEFVLKTIRVPGCSVSENQKE